MHWRCLFGRHRWEPRAVTHFRYREDGTTFTELLDICRDCKERRETTFHGQRTLDDFKTSPSAMVEDLLKQTKEN